VIQAVGVARMSDLILSRVSKRFFKSTILTIVKSGVTELLSHISVEIALISHVENNVRIKIMLNSEGNRNFTHQPVARSIDLLSHKDRHFENFVS
jgi:hypothetical protein